jgi:Asp-tRNA(Asn)/Glu-tRNA(Gln) amidotransferase A subunit family amidase
MNDAELAQQLYLQDVMKAERLNELKNFRQELRQEADNKAMQLQKQARKKYEKDREERIRLLLLNSIRDEVLDSTNNATNVVDLILTYLAPISHEQYKLIANNKLIVSKK